MGATRNISIETRRGWIAAAVVITMLATLAVFALPTASAGAAVDTTAPVLTSQTGARTLVPGQCCTVVLNYWTNEPAAVTATLIRIDRRAVVRSDAIVLRGSNGTVRWNATTQTGLPAPAGAYWMVVTAVDEAGNVSRPQVASLAVVEPE